MYAYKSTRRCVGAKTGATNNTYVRIPSFGRRQTRTRYKSRSWRQCQAAALIDRRDMPKAEGTVALNNYLQAKSQLAALSWQDSTSGPKSAPTWTSVCKIFGEVRGTGVGSLKRAARDAAANQALKSLTEETK